MKRDDSMHDLAMLLARGILGASIAAHGAQKLYGWFDGPGLEGAGKFMGSLGFEPGERYARMASLTEIAAGTLIATGMLGPIGPAMLASVMTTAVGSVHLKNGYWNENKGFELNTMYALGALLLASNGFGRLSLDRVTGLRSKASPMLGVLGIAAGIGAGLLILSKRTPSKSQSTANGTARPTTTGTIESSFERTGATE